MSARARLVLFLAMFSLPGAPLLGQRAPEEMLQSALYKQQVEGDLGGAIELLQALVEDFSENRAVAARALVQLGLAHEILGSTEAERRVYERVINEYPDQLAAAERARTRLADLDQGTSGAAETGTVARLIWSGPFLENMATPSADGARLYVTDRATGDVAVRDVATGEMRRLTEEQPIASEGFYMYTLPSPDGETVVSSFYSWVNDQQHLRIVDGGRSRTLYANENGEMVDLWPFGFTPDGAHVSVRFMRADGTNQFALVSMADGSTRTLRSLDWGEMYPSLSPDGRYVAYDFPPLEDSPERDVYVLATDGSSERRLVEHPADDSQPVWMPDGSGIVFVSDRTGDLDAWFLPVTDGRPDGPPELVHRSLGDVFLRGLTEEGSLFYTTRRRQSNVYLGELDSEQRTLTREPEQLASRAEGTGMRPDFSPDGRFLVNAAQRDHRPVLMIRSLETGEEREIALPGLRYGGGSVRWSPDGGRILSLGTDAQGRATFLVVDPVTGESEVLRHGPGGHVVWGSGGRTLLYRQGVDGSDLNRLVAYDLETGEERILYTHRERISSLALSPDGRSIAFQSRAIDRPAVMVVPVDGGAAREVFSESVDSRMRGLAWAKDGKALLFVRIKADAPGSVDPGEVLSTLWSVPLDDGEPREIGVLSEGRVRELVVHPDGRRFAFRLDGGYASEVWLLESFLSHVKPTAAPEGR